MALGTATRLATIKTKKVDRKVDKKHLYHLKFMILIKFFRRNGASGRDRTTDTTIFSRMLYQLSYRGIAAATV